ncbi:MAG TPA: signal peptidase I [Saprospiraceae bacterium]|nr:signal peptidase I [Saprospiraceae bacterium]
MSILIFLIISYIFLSISLYLLFPKAKVPAWKGLVPGVNFVEWCELIGRSPWHAAWLLFPIVNIFIFCGMAVDMVRSFRMYKLIHSTVAVIYAPAIFIYIARNKDLQYDGPTLIKEKEFKAQVHEAMTSNNTRKLSKLQASNPYKKSAGREWFEAIVFAVFAAAFIRMFLIEAYKIPTPSMEGSLLVGDFLFVSKAHYGMRMPMTPLMIPLLHNRVPIIGGESYFESIQLPYRRLPALEKIMNNDPIVFNWPVGDSVYLTPSRSWTAEQVKNDPALTAALRGQKVITRPIDKKDHYIKRCIAIAGDTLQIIDRQVYINGVPAVNPSKLQYHYNVMSSTPLNKKWFVDHGINPEDHPYGLEQLFWLDKDQAAALSQLEGVTVEILNSDQLCNLLKIKCGSLFPNDPKNFGTWTNDNYGPIWIPKAGVTIPITPENIALYRRVIQVYEHNDYAIRDGKIYINGNVASEYTFRQDYYWAMGDNRHNSEDSRVWGFVPADHIVGKPLFIWMSTGDGIRWNRLFTSAHKM